VGDDVVHPGPLRAPVEVLDLLNVPPGSLRAQAGVMLGAPVLAPTMEGVGGEEGPSGPLMGPVEQAGPWALLELLVGRMPPLLGALPSDVSL